MLGPGSVHAAECHEGGFVGVDFEIEQDLANELPDNLPDFNRKLAGQDSLNGGSGSNAN